MNLAFASLAVGDEIPPLVLPPVTRHTLALYCGASGDHNPLHTDIDFARKAGLPDVIAHGMLSMAWLGRALTQWAPQKHLRSFGVRFVAQTQIGDIITCTGKVTEKIRVDGEQRIRLTLQAQKQTGDITLIGDAEVSMS
jgi:acyl dehydratase